MRKITLFLALMVAMVTTAFAQSIDASKQYYLKSPILVGTNQVTAYMNLAPKYTINSEQPNTSALLLETSQALTIEKVWEGTGTDPFYIISAMVVEGTSGEVKKYLGSGNWDATLVSDANSACRFEFVSAGTNGFYIRRANSDKYLKSDYLSAKDGIYTVGVYTDGDATSAATWTLEEVAAEPAGLTVVSQSPAADVQVESLASITIEFNKAIKLDWEDPFTNGTGTGGAATGGAATGGAATGGDATGTGSISCINLKARDMSNAATAWFSQAVVDGNKITFNFEAAVKTTGTYTFTIPADLIVAAEGDEKYAGGEFTFKVYAPAAPTYSSSSFGEKINGTTCYSLDWIKVKFSENIEIVGTEALELKNGEEVVATITEMEVFEGKSLCLYLDKALTNEVTTTYSIVIPAGYVKTAGTDLGLAADKTINNIKVYAPFEVKNITPANGETVEAIENIVIEFSKPVMDYNLNGLVLKNVDGEVALAGSANGNVLTLTPAGAVANGTYTLSQVKTGANGFTVLASGEGDGVVNAPVYTITVDAPELEALVPTSYAKNAANDYELQGVKINFAEVVKKAADVTEYGKIVDAEGNTVAVLNSLMGANGSSHTFATPYTSTAVTTPGTYKVIVYSGVFFNADGTKEFKGAEYEFEVAELPAPEVVSIDAPTGTVTSMNYYVDFGINIYNSMDVVLADDKTVTYTVGEEVFEAEVAVYAYGINRNISISFPWNVTYPYGDYTLTIPAGLYTVNGVANAEEVYTFTYAEPTPTPGEGEGGEGGEVEPVTVTVTPASGSVVEQIDAIQVLFSDAAMYGNIGYLYMYDQNENMYLLAPAPDYGTGVFVPVNMLDDQPIVITEPGTYTLDLSDFAEFGLTGEMSFSWTVSNTTAIDAVDAEAENAVIYDLTGRRVEKITKAGIYVINGVKKVVK